jgi:pimeloyl-ACP methyl ester carboxylesterase
LLAVPWRDIRLLARVAGPGSPIRLSRFDWIARADELAVPALILHGSADTSAPIAMAAHLRDLRPNIVQLESFSADHTTTWNSDPDRGRAAVASSLRLPDDADDGFISETVQ